MFLKKALLSSVGLSVLLLGLQPLAKAQSIAEATFESAPAVETADSLTNLDAATFTTVETESTEFDVAQARRRTRNVQTRRATDFVGVGADFGYADDVSFAVISKLSLSDSIALRPSVLIGDDFSVLVPVTYEFDQFSDEISDFQVRPYAGIGASYSDSDNDEDINLLLSAGADIPLSQRFTLNAQANLGVFNDTDFGVTVGVGYNFGQIFR